MNRTGFVQKNMIVSDDSFCRNQCQTFRADTSGIVYEGIIFLFFIHTQNLRVPLDKAIIHDPNNSRGIRIVEIIPSTKAFIPLLKK